MNSRANILESPVIMDFLQIREDYKLAYHRWEQCAERLCVALNCNFGDLEAALLAATTRALNRLSVKDCNSNSI